MYMSWMILLIKNYRTFCLTHGFRKQSVVSWGQGGVLGKVRKRDYQRVGYILWAGEYVNYNDCFANFTGLYLHQN